ncbi:MAG TPA: retropepsin-like aspartic protease [Chlamydiales bacterium]|nr:retropepsin-like aspartic protease [Chlamydiales bacterium]
MEIEGEPLSTMLDLGFRGDVKVVPEFLEKIKKKKWIGSGEKYAGKYGKAYPRDYYGIPKIKIGKVNFYNPILEKENIDSHKDSVFVEGGGEPSPPEPGTLGWHIFGKSNLFLDLQNSLIALCDSVETLDKEGYSKSTFIKIPLHTERGFLECEGLYNDQPLRFVLDSGCTWNLLNTPAASTLDELIWDPQVIAESSVAIGERDFGKMEFRKVPIPLPIHVDAVLGMNFLSKHRVFIDFNNGYLYFAPSDKVIAVSKAPPSKNRSAL